MQHSNTGVKTQIAGSMRQHWPLLVVLVLYAAAIVFINPMREYALVDDWSYARTVKTLYETGEYHPFPTIVASFQVQADWAMLFVWGLGFSFASLHLSTLAAVALGLIGFYCLCLVHDFAPPEAGVLSLTLIGCQQILLYSFSFMTDVTFLSTLSITLALYSAGLKKNNRWLMLVGGVAATTMLLIRPTGIAVLVGLGVLWLLEPDRKSRIAFYAIGLCLPVLFMTVWQALNSTRPPTWASYWVVEETAKFLSDPGVFVPEFLWRLMAIAEFLAWFGLPVAALALADFVKRLLWQGGQRLLRSDKVIVGILVVYMVCASVYGMIVMRRLSIMPMLPLFPNELLVWPLPLLILLTLFTIVSGSVMAWTLARRMIMPSVWRTQPAYAHLMDVSAVLMAGATVAYYHLADRYLFGLMPFAIIGMASMMRESIHQWRWQFRAITLATFVGAVLWVRGVVERYEANWGAADAVYQSGIAEERIKGPWEWNSYRGAFEQYLDETGTETSLTEYASTWLPERWKQAEYVITSDPALAEQPGWEVTATGSYENMFLQTVRVYTLRKQEDVNPKAP
jgi:hypothetical protein